MRYFLALVLLLLSASLSFAQAPTKLCITTNGTNCIEISPTYPLPVTSECTNTAVVNVSAATTTEIVALTTGSIIRVCAFVLTADTVATTATFVYGTGTDCATGTTSLTGAMRLQDEGNISLASSGSLIKVPVSNALCLTAATGAVTGFVTYSKHVN